MQDEMNRRRSAKLHEKNAARYRAELLLVPTLRRVWHRVLALFGVGIA